MSLFLSFFLTLLLLSKPIFCAQDAFSLSSLGDPFSILFLLIFVSLLPFLAIMFTSFTKIVVVLSITRQALGTAQTPPNMVIVALSIILTVFSMRSVFTPVYEQLAAQDNFYKKPPEEMIKQLSLNGIEPLRSYLATHTQNEDKALFAKIINEDQEAIAVNDFIVLAPAFLISQLSQAFQMGFLIYLPFLVVDMVVANILMALGMQMLSPTTISLPFKILLFVLVDGWRLLAQALAAG